MAHTPEPPGPGTLLLTGASGMVGGEILRRLLERGDRDVVALVRRPLGIDHPRLRTLTADLVEDELGELPADVTTVLHCAASISFTAPLPEQRAINVGGTAKLLAAAAALPALERFTHVSTAYVAGRHHGCAPPELLDAEADFRNDYERSKAEAELLVRSSGLPWQVLRPSIVVGDQHTGRTTAFNVIYPLMRAYHAGTLYLAPGRQEAYVDVVPVDHVADAALALLEHPTGRTHQIVAGPRAPRLSRLLDLGSQIFERPPVKIMELAEVEAYVAGLPEGARETTRRALERARPFLPYFDVACYYEDPATERFLAGRGLATPDLADYLPVLVDYAVAANWGRPPRTAPAA